MTDRDTWAAGRCGWDRRVKPRKVSIKVDSSKVQRLKEVGAGNADEVSEKPVKQPGLGSGARVGVVCFIIPSV